MRFLFAAVLATAFAIPAAHTAQPPTDPTKIEPKGADKEKVKMDAETKKAVDLALRFLAKEQGSDGSWGNTAITGFVLLAFMSNGHVPNQGEYGKNVAKGVDYLLQSLPGQMMVIWLAHKGGNMYCHGMATLALTQVYGMTGDEDVKKVTKKAIDLIIKTQNNEGGWRYDPSPTGADISVTIMQVMALRGAKDAGLHVPDKTMANSIKYINRCRDNRTGGYKYPALFCNTGAGYARTAAGVCALQLCGEYEADDIKKAVEFMERAQDDNAHYWYGHYYAAHALNQVGGEVWEKYYKRMRDRLLAVGYQKPGGEWYDGRREAAYGPAYQTAIAVLILSVPTHYLPIYQK